MEDKQLGKAGAAQLRDRLMGVLIGIARAVDGNEHLITDSTDQVLREGLSAALTDSEESALACLIRCAEDEKRRLIPHCYECAAPCGKNSDYDMQRLWTAEGEVRSLKLLLLYSIQGMAVRLCRASVERTDREVSRFFYQALFTIGEENFGVQEMLPVMKKAGEAGLRCMALLDN